MVTLNWCWVLPLSRLRSAVLFCIYLLRVSSINSLTSHVRPSSTFGEFLVLVILFQSVDFTTEDLI